MSAFLDYAPEDHDAGVMHWVMLTGYGLSARRGDHGEFATLIPNDGDPIVSDADSFLRLQRLADGPSRIHLDLHVGDVAAAATHAVSLGAVELADHGYRVLQSPGGFTFCFVSEPAARRPAPSGWRGGQHSLLDQVCVDVPQMHWDREPDFWASLTGWDLDQGRHPQFAFLRRPEGQPLRILLQRLDDPEGDVRAHLDWATTDRSAEVARHVAAGSTVVAEHDLWTVMRGPGSIYCVTDRDPTTGMLT